MFEKKILKIKFVFSLFTTFLLLFIVGGVYYMKDEAFLSEKNFFGIFDYFRYSMEYYGMQDTVLLASAGLLGNGTSYQSREDMAVSVPVLVYHGILEEDDHSEINITKEQFKKQMFALKDAGYETITPDELLLYMRNEREIPEKSFMITFDDGRSDSFYNADPILKALRYKATMFAVGKYALQNSPGGYYLSAGEIKRMQNSGRWEIESHSYNGHDRYPVSESGQTGNFFSNKLWIPEKNRIETDREYRVRVAEDLAESQKSFEEALGTQINSFAFPFSDFAQDARGNYPDATNVLIQEAKKYYDLLYYQHAPDNHYTQNYHISADDETSFLIRRITVNADWDGEDIIREFNASKAKEIPYQDTFNKDQGWVSTWGNVEIKNGSLRIYPAIGQTGSSVLLDGSRAWRDYILTATVESPDRNNVFVWFRYQDDNNNAACNFGEGFAHVEQFVDGKKGVIKGNRSLAIVIPEGDFTVSLAVEDRKAKCMINEKVLVETEFLDESLTDGGIGFKNWDRTLHSSELIVKDLKINHIQSKTEIAGSTMGF